MIISNGSKIISAKFNDEYDYILLNERPSHNYISLPSKLTQTLFLKALSNSLKRKRSVFIISSIEGLNLDSLYINTNKHFFFDQNYIFVNLSIRSKIFKIKYCDELFSFSRMTNLFRDLQVAE
ncbi:MAG: hypothetical protein CES88_08810 [Halobacteriovorax sp. JY17]|nr:MAG: hypothetical protein CES88_08810 [Halobacteriovorax sp. JY17]